MTITLYGWGSMFDAPSPSPFVMKADIHLQMFGVPFERAVADLEAVPKHKAPYLRDGNMLIEDSTFIRRHMEAKLGTDLDHGLTPEQRGAAWALEIMLEHRLTPIMACERWLIDTNFERGPSLFFTGVPAAMREAVTKQVRADLGSAMRGAGHGRHSRAEQMQLARADITAAARILGDKPYFFGCAPTAANGAGFGVLESCNTRFFDSELPDLIAEHDNLVAYLGHMRSRFFAEERWPAMG